ncbi:hypothetical protein CQW23_21024 [Capsicum baccatum]|uniref:Uncharacterized protein n=1 Tax=Capsicum baccatum TaxID=33114 RepID=A0A2G2VWV7_CAPBA|nr:hypothetical protein CQW23_21024 [Capsicum baccatum]
MLDVKKLCYSKNIPSPLEVPVPYALAISRLGNVEVTSLVKDLICIATLMKRDVERWMLPIGECWSPLEYAKVVELCKFERESWSNCQALPRILYIARALVHQASLSFVEFCKSWSHDRNFTGYSKDIPRPLEVLVPYALAISRLGNVDLSALPEVGYGSMLRHPRQDIRVDSFFTINDPE